jgi:Cys-rich four helix bundle protein (predicted Tat secretion target)
LNNFKPIKTTLGVYQMSDHGNVPQNSQTTRLNISRRDILLGLSAAAAAAYAGAATASGDEHEHSEHMHKKHDHSKHKVQLPDVLDAVNLCLDKGRRCTAHCLVTYQEGDLSLADCASKVHEMMAICEGFAYLLSANSEYTKAYANLCAQVCMDCERECRKHDQHIECRACADACQETVDQIKLRIS